MNTNNNLSPPLTEAFRTSLTKAVKGHSRSDHSTQRAFNQLLSVYPAALVTTEINTECAISNVSDVVCTINKKIAPLGFCISCHKPPTPFKNRFGQNTQMGLWRLHKLPDAANDSKYSQTKGK